MSPQPPRVPTEKVVAIIADQFSRYDRTPFAGMLADAVACKPSLTSWGKLAAKHPDKHAQAVVALSKPVGFAERTETRVIRDPFQLMRDCIELYGAEEAKSMFKLVGLPEDAAVALIGQVEKVQTS